ncbi:flagellin lysine-N-methylase [Paenibacillus filicis]|uniref:Flagellin lysine-N-methylase n=1 Tax=Paenibacillus gyeongsangnamensis TaxID=3388067 RepID=A0ABT4QDC2_9BACL|nr:flagellin lysine-N-methylase [Paenibacillus filicis]MCZ8514884.1 flagellin lysine-N-methylase [Paenibacillus filicis]
MITTKINVLIPQYLNKFSCIGSDCEDSCCSGWRVDIDKATYKKYSKIRDKELSSMINNKVKRTRSDATSENYAGIEMDSNHNCPFLSEQKLCKIQLKLGEDYLANICATYPRTLQFVDDVLEKSASMSCPEIARLALLNPNKMEFDLLEESITVRNQMMSQISTKVDATDQIIKYFWDLRSFTIDVLQNRNFQMWERLIALGMFYQKLDEYVNKGLVSDIPQLISLYKSIFSEDSFKSTLNDLPTKNTFQLKLIQEIAEQRFQQSITSQRYLECFSETLQGIQFSDEREIEEISVHYQEAHEKYYLPFMKEHEYILEHYLVNYVYKNLIPISRGNKIFDEYMILIVHYSMIKLHLIGMAGFYKVQFSSEHVIKLIQSYSKTIEHNPLYLKQIIELLHSSGVNSMAYMALLIKN